MMETIANQEKISMLKKAAAWDLLAEKLLTLPLPQHIYIEPTNDCRLRCSICPHKSRINRVGCLEFGIFEKIIQELAQFSSPKDIILHKNGEPLLHPRLPQMIKYIKKYLPFTQISFSTSGVPLERRLSQKILNAAPDKIFISYGNLLLDAKNKKTAEIVSREIKEFLMIRRAIRKTRPRIILRFIDKNGDFRVFTAKKTGWQDMADEIEIRPYHSWCGYFKKDYAIPKRRVPCLSLWTTLAINWDGDASICSLDYAKEGIIGTIRKSSIKDIWQSKELTLYRKKHLCNDYKNLKPCEYCAEWRHNREFWTKSNLKKAIKYL